MGIEVKLYNNLLQDAWDRFVRLESRNGCIFHEQKFLGYHEEGRFNDASLVFAEQDTIVGVLPAAITERDGKCCVVSHPGSSAGGLVFHRKHGLRAVLEMLEKAIEYFRELGVNSLEIRLAEPIFSDPTDSELTYLLWHRGFRLVTREIGSCVNLRAGAWLEFGRKKNGNEIRRMEKLGGTVVRQDTPDGIYPLILQTLDGRYGKNPTHTLEELRELKIRYPERLQFWAALYEGVPIAAIVLFSVNDHVVHNFYTGQNYDFARLKIMPSLFYAAFHYYQEKGFEWFNFGISSRGDWIKWGILEFKERVGGRATIRDVWGPDDLQNYQDYRFNEE